MEVDYEDKLILAPMVRMCTLPFRLLASECGADLTYRYEKWMRWRGGRWYGSRVLLALFCSIAYSSLQ